LSKKKSLEAVYRSLLRYIRNHCDTVDPVALKEPVDLNAIAEHDDEQQMVKVATSATKLELGLTDMCDQLLAMFLIAAVNGASIDKYVGRLLETLDIDTQTEIKDIIQMVCCTTFSRSEGS
jgi:protein HOOK3